ncbi:site-specific DNA-methyltransferase [Stenotrophomonas sp. C3(2023)]|uniref:site-specific DNA-methyltransferase n=1 Tax=Stenotrophomonas sp. C3(2023) TaxID=3080277 RepID=UPI00293C48F6|nr:site-specific DNA-methyltransferase [Stenotrophomonas sp. C3(2023)]MDV3469848.1 site-specific DNA-methyltransferase [Stenotrophomonas sp. C3(2023)]
MPLLSWFNRDADLTRAALTPYRLLEPVAKLSYGEEDSPNMLIEGDNLDALKALLPYYAGQVKCIFIDPPYNTRSAFEHYDDNLEHSKWLSMMYPRLELLRDLLAEDGSMWVTLDDHEAHYFKVIADEVFGRSNFVTEVAWQKVFAKKNKAQISVSHDHLFVYAKKKDKWSRNLVPRTQGNLDSYKNVDNDPRGVWTSVAYSVPSENAERRAAYRYDIELPGGGSIGPPAGRHWNGLPDRTAEMIADNRLWFGKTGTSRPREKVFLSEGNDGVVPDTWWTHQFAGSNQDAKKEMLALFPDMEPFSTPKPEQLVRMILEIGSNEGDLVLDSFLGSGTTAAVAHKMKRRWIGVEEGEHARTYCQTRLTKVVEGEKGGISPDIGWQGGGGFRFYKLGVSVFDEDGHIRESIKFEQLAAHVWFAETGSARSTRAAREAFLGEHEGVGYYLLFNGILGDVTKAGGNVLTRALLRKLPKFEGPKVIYGEACALPTEQLRELEIVFKQTPYDIKAR